MTYQATAPNTLSQGGFFNALSHIGAHFRSIGHAMVENSSGNRRLKVVRALQAKSDAELAALKIKREDIVHHVFRDCYYA